MLNLGAVGRPWRQFGIDTLWYSKQSQSGSVISHQGLGCPPSAYIWPRRQLGGGEARCPAVIQRLAETATLCPDLANSGPSFLSPCFLGSVTWL